MVILFHRFFNLSDIWSTLNFFELFSISSGRTRFDQRAKAFSQGRGLWVDLIVDVFVVELIAVELFFKLFAGVLVGLFVDIFAVEPLVELFVGLFVAVELFVDRFVVDDIVLVDGFVFVDVFALVDGFVFVDAFVLVDNVVFGIDIWRRLLLKKERKNYIFRKESIFFVLIGRYTEITKTETERKKETKHKEKQKITCFAVR